MRELAGAIAMDLPRYARALARRDPRAYLRLTNRDEHLEDAPAGDGVRCLWRWTSDLHAPRQLPVLGRWLMRRALGDHPVRLAPARARAETPQVSFIIGHRGETRVPLLLATIASIAAQSQAAVECIVVQQEAQGSLAGRLPPWVRLVHTPPADAALPFCRSWAFNLGARHASAPVLVLHDNDLLVPAGYAARIVRLVGEGWDVVNLKRFIFYLAREHSREVMADAAALFDRAPETIMQNAQGGGSIAITRAAFDAIGGMDESFVGWGGEDNEFFERACLRPTWHWGELPLVHLWHESQPRKYVPDSATALRYRTLAATPPEERVRVLVSRPRGEAGGPFAPEDTSEARGGAMA